MKKVSGFACRCGEDGKRAMAELHDWVAKEVLQGPPKPENYVTTLLYELAAPYSAWIEGVPLDPGGWGAIVTEAIDDKALAPPEGLHVYMQFDRFEDGLALTLKKMFEEYGPRRTYEEEDDDGTDV